MTTLNHSYNNIIKPANNKSTSKKNEESEKLGYQQEQQQH